MNRIDRLAGIILLLQGRRLIKAEEIAAHFEISLRTVYRDIAALSEAGVPVIAEAGVGYSLLKGYHIPPVMFTAEEASALFLSGELAEHLTDPSLQAQMRSALLKIRSVLPREKQDHLDRLQGKTALFIAPQKNRRQSGAVLTPLQNALAQRRVIALTYQGGAREEPTERAVEPLGLVFYSGHWHLIGYCRLRKDVRDFRTDRIAQLAVREETFAPRDDFSLREFVRCWDDRQHKGVHVSLRFTRRAAERARNSWPAEAAEEIQSPEGIVFNFVTGALDWITGWLLSFGMEVEVLAPAELRELLAAHAAKLARHHGR